MLQAPALDRTEFRRTRRRSRYTQTHGGLDRLRERACPTQQVANSKSLQPEIASPTRQTAARRRQPAQRALWLRSATAVSVSSGLPRAPNALRSPSGVPLTLPTADQQYWRRQSTAPRPPRPLPVPRLSSPGRLVEIRMANLE